MSSSRKSGLLLYLEPGMLRLVAFGFASGLPYLLVFSTLSAWLREEGVSLTDIGWFGLAGTAYVLKFAWAPLVDQVPLPLLTRRLGQRRSWLILAQAGVVGALIAISLTDPGKAILVTAAWVVVLAFFSATQDIVADAYRIDSLETETQAPGAGIFVGGYRLGTLAAGAGALILADVLDWQTAYRVMAVAMGLAMVATVLSPEPKPVRVEDTSRPWVKRAMIDPFRSFMERRLWFPILVFIAAFQVGEGLLGLMANPFYIDLGFTKTEIAVVTKGWGFAMAILGGLAGGWLGYRMGLIPALLLAGVFQAASNLAFAWLAGIGPDVGALTLVIAVENFSGAMAAALFVGFISSLCAAEYSATQFALLTALAALGRKVFVVAGGAMADALGWETYFFVTALAALPALVLLVFLLIKRRHG